MNPVLYEKMAIIGCGLIGSSVARAARARGVTARIAVADPSPRVRERVAALGFADQVTDDPAVAVRDADLVMFAAPPLAIGPAAALTAGALKPGATISDVGSVKAAVADALAEVMPAHMTALRRVGVPYTDAQIASAAQDVQGKTELDATIAYLQVLGLALK